MAPGGGVGGGVRGGVTQMHVIHCHGNVTVSVNCTATHQQSLTRVSTDRLFPQTPGRKPVCFVYNVSFVGFEMK